MAARAIPQAIIRDIRRLIAELDKENIRTKVAEKPNKNGLFCKTICP